MFEKWVIDCSVSHPEGMCCFCPYEDDGMVVVGMSFISDRCPGELVGIFHCENQKKAEEWAKQNPDWYEKYKKQTIN